MPSKPNEGLEVLNFSTFCRLSALPIILSLPAFVLPSTVLAQQVSSLLSGPDSTPNLLSSDAQEKDDLLNVDAQQGFDDWKAGIKERFGLDFGIDYNVLGYTASSSLGERKSASGAFRLFGTWDLVNREGPNTGSLIFKFENRHAFTTVPPTGFGGELGYAGLNSSVFSDQGWRATHLYWQQEFAQGRGVAYIGWLDVTDFVDVYALASPWTGFSNIAFQTGSGTIGGLPDGALGAMAGGFLTDNIYASAGIADANADPTDPISGFDTLFDQGETFKSLEIGWTSGAEALFVNNAHLTFWQIDARQQAGTPGGHGIAFSYTHVLGDAWLPFIRGGWADDGGSLYEAAVSAGFGYTRQPGRNLLGVGLNWSRPNDTTFGPNLRDQYTLEVFQQWQLTEGLELTPSVQIIKNPALNPNKDTVALFGLRFRASF
ncbi:porin [Ruegeria marina]|uniref:Porin n=1 Tax=Ruegeria marina TaxID=639004 RepID=A0A1G7EEV3_9RHOB|nr:porin [Ruegeria marina]